MTAGKSGPTWMAVVRMRERYLRGDSLLWLPAGPISAGGTAAWLLPDRMGSVRNVVDNTGAVIDIIVYDGFGNVVSESDPGNGGTYLWDGYRFDATGAFQAGPECGAVLQSVCGAMGDGGSDRVRSGRYKPVEVRGE